MVRLQVRDSGIGIAAVDLPHIFEPFFTEADVSRHSSGQFEFGRRGLGLGLSLVRAFVHLHGGSVEVDSALGQGTTFTITLPTDGKSLVTSRRNRAKLYAAMHQEKAMTSVPESDLLHMLMDNVPDAIYFKDLSKSFYPYQSRTGTAFRSGRPRRGDRQDATSISSARRTPGRHISTSRK